MIHGASASDPNSGALTGTGRGDVRVILVGKTGFDGTLRLDPAVEVVRARTAMDAIGELADPIDDESPRESTVIVGPDIRFDEGRDESRQFIAGLRLIDPRVRVLAVGEGAAPSSFDGLVPPGTSASDLRVVVRAPHGRGVLPASPGAEPMVLEPKPAGSSPADRPSRVSELPETPGDAPVLRSLLTGRDIVLPALEMIRARVGSADVVFVPVTGTPGKPAVGTPVVYKGRDFGRLRSAAVPAAALEPQADWLAHWLAVRDQQEQLRQAAFTDDLTGAWNRRYCDRFLKAAIEHAQNHRHTVSVLHFDIDDFKRFNDQYGHAAGDSILRETVSLLKSVIRPTDRVCRVGGDEFVVVFHEPGGPRDPASKPPSSIQFIAQRFQRQVAEHRFPLLSDEAPGRLTISGGLASYPWDGLTAAELINHADQRALASKRSGKNAISFGPIDT